MLVWGIIIALASFIVGGIISYHVCITIASKMLTDIEFELFNPLLVRLNLVKQCINGDTSNCVTQDDAQKLIQDCINMLHQQKAL